MMKRTKENILILALQLMLFAPNLLSQNDSSSESDYYIFVSRAANYIEADMLDSAAVALQSAMRLDPANSNNSALLLNLGVIQRQLGLLDDAYISFTAALSRYPESDVVLHNRASLLCLMERYNEAKDDYSTIIGLYPDDTEAYYRRGSLYLAEDDIEKAEADFRKAEEIDPDDTFTLLSKALRYKLNDKWEEAVKVYTVLIKESPKPNPIYYLNRAECYLNIDKISKASADLFAISDTQKDNAYYYVLRGRIRQKQFDKYAAREDYLEAKSLGYDEVIVDELLQSLEK